MTVYVIAKNGQPLMPTERCGKVRKMLKDKKVKVVKRCPFTIQLLYEGPAYTQDVTLGIDAGYKHIGACASTSKKVLYAAQVEERTDIVKLLQSRRELRRARRNRKTRYREPRFNNRVHSRKKGWLSPSVEHKISTHIKVVKDVMAILPVTKVRIETAEFDIHKLKNPAIQGLGYQHGEKYGHYNTRNYVLWRDGHRCRCCGRTDGYLYVVSVDGSETEAPEDLRTVCKGCLEKHLSGEKRFDFKRKRHFAPPTQMGIMRDTLLARLEASVDVPVERTYGYVTKGVRAEHDIPKSHINDAFCIAGNMGARRTDTWYLQRKVRRHNRQMHKLAIGKGGYRKDNQAPYTVYGFRLFDKVRYGGKEYFVFGRRKTGYFNVRTLDGEKANNGDVSYKKLVLLETRKGMLTQLCHAT